MLRTKRVVELMQRGIGGYMRRIAELTQTKPACHCVIQITENKTNERLLTTEKR